MTIICLKSKEEDIFEVDVKNIQMSGTLKMMLEDIGQVAEGEILNVSRISSECMRLIIEWVTYREDHPPEITYEARDEDEEPRDSTLIDSWDKQFLESLPTPTLFELLTACHYLDIKGLTDAIAKTIANMIRGKSPEQIRQVFNFQLNFRRDEDDGAIR